MQIAKTPGVVPRIADILIIGVRPSQFDRIQRNVEDGLKGMHMGWSCTVNLGKSFDQVIDEFLPKRPELDLVYIANEVRLTAETLRKGVTRLSFELAKHCAKPCVVLAESLAWLANIFHAKGIKVYFSIEGALTERHAQREAA